MIPFTRYGDQHKKLDIGLIHYTQEYYNKVANINRNEWNNKRFWKSIITDPNQMIVDVSKLYHFVSPKNILLNSREIILDLLKLSMRWKASPDVLIEYALTPQTLSAFRDKRTKLGLSNSNSIPYYVNDYYIYALVSYGISEKLLYPNNIGYFENWPVLF